jgi:putative FmdB family regulatory protein
MPRREYRCRVCGATEERSERWDDRGPQACPKCQATAYHRVPQATLFHLKGGSADRLVGGTRPFIRERVVQNGDGSETKYGSLQEARRGEWERSAQVTPNAMARAKLAQRNAHDLASGMLPGRDSTKFRQAVEEPRR